MKFSLKLFLFFSFTALAACAGETTLPSLSETSPEAPKRIASKERVINEPVSNTVNVIPDRLIENPTRIAILLPLSGDREEVGQALLNAASMALFDAYDPRITLLPFDTKASFEGANEAVIAAIEADVDIVLGPLFSESIRAAAPLLIEKNITMIGFSSDKRVAGRGQFIMGFAPEDEVRRVVSYAANNGHNNFAALIPKGLYGGRVLTAFGEVLESSHANMMALEEYSPAANMVFDPVKRLASYTARKRMRDDELRAMKAVNSDVTLDIIKDLEKKEVLGEVNYTAVLVPEGGQLLRTIAPLLPYYEVDPAKVQLLGTGLWNDNSLLSEPPLQGAWFAAPELKKPKEFMAKYKVIYGVNPPRIATLAYDAMALVAMRMRHSVVEERYSLEALLNAKGFHGIDGLFRFKSDGTVERALAIIEIHRDGFKVIDKAPRVFPRFKNFVIRPIQK